MKPSKKSVRLTTHVVPTRYDIHLIPDLKSFTFKGEETIELKLKKPAKAITLHAKDLNIASAEILGKVANKARISFNDKAETATFTFKSPIAKGSARLRIAFSGVLNDNMHGFYKSSYTHEGKTKHIATTQFESTDARRAFPCFDEPAMKAVFDVSLTVPATSTAISNTIPTTTTKNRDGTKTVTFAPTPLMSTYLLAFIVGEFECVQKRSKDGVLVRVFVTPGKKYQARFALDCAAKTISFFNTYFDIPYPLPVLDLIAIPDFSAGAMENWGAITYRESALLVDPVHSSTMNKQWVALVIAHEIAHQWFGNLVTMEWWTHLWLNEGFASYIEYLAVDHIFPKWDIWTQFLYSDFGAALKADGLKHTHAIEIEVHHPAEIAAVFDAVSYSKGASIIRMLADYLGEKDFRNGLRYYLKKHRYGNTSTIDLWNALAKVSKKPVAKIMSNWTGKAGYPLIAISEGTTHFDLRQSRFFSSGISKRNTHDTTLWHVPVSFERGGGKAGGRFIMDTRSARIPKDGTWLKLNINESSFHRTSYPDRLRDLLAESVSLGSLPTRDRLGLIRDIFSLAETGELSAKDGLEFARHYLSESEYVVWSEIASGLSKIHALIAHEPFLKEYETFARSIFAGIAKKVDWRHAPSDHSKALLRVLILGSIGRYGDTKTLERARKLFARIRGGANPVSADLRGIVYDLVARSGGAKEYTKLTRMYKAADLHEEKNRIGRALGSFGQKALLKKTLALALSKHVRRQDSVRMISSVIVNPAGNDAAWAFITAHWKALSLRYAASRELSYLLAPMEVSTSTKRAKEIEAFLRKHPAPGTGRTVQQILEHIHSNAAWLSRDKKSLAAFLRK
ncbi:MAG: M1 family metallopeptidase [Candidatus Paceibacterota bacterium]